MYPFLSEEVPRLFTDIGVRAFLSANILFDLFFLWGVLIVIVNGIEVLNFL
jgi:hypothetical protein